PLGGCTTMNPPPPILPAAGYVTASAKAVATAASTALPPLCKMSRPTSEAGAETENTLPLRPGAGFFLFGSSPHNGVSQSENNRADANQRVEDWERGMLALKVGKKGIPAKPDSDYTR